MTSCHLCTYRRVTVTSRTRKRVLYEGDTLWAPRRDPSQVSACAEWRYLIHKKNHDLRCARRIDSVLSLSLDDSMCFCCCLTESTLGGSVPGQLASESLWPQAAFVHAAVTAVKHEGFSETSPCCPAPTTAQARRVALSPVGRVHGPVTSDSVTSLDGPHVSATAGAACRSAARERLNERLPPPPLLLPRWRGVPPRPAGVKS